MDSSPVILLISGSETHSRAYMINKSGDTIADVTLETITTQNVERDAGRYSLCP